MSNYNLHSTISEIVIARPILSRVFENLGINYCCAGKQNIEEACRRNSLDADTMVTVINALPTDQSHTEIQDINGLSLAELTDHIEQTHHVFLKLELPRLEALMDKVVAAHADHDPRLHKMCEVFQSMTEELFPHLEKEERVLFPMIRALESSVEPPVFHCGPLSGPIGRMMQEHGQSGDSLHALRSLSDGYKTPEGVCGSFRSLFEGLARLDHDLCMHIHKESNVLYPRALELERLQFAQADLP